MALGSGAITLDGVDTHQASLAQLRQHLGAVPKDSTAVSTTKLDIMLFGWPAATEAAVIAAAQAAVAHDPIATLPQGCNTYRGERGPRLSGGQLQRISMARRC